MLTLEDMKRLEDMWDKGEDMGRNTIGQGIILALKGSRKVIVFSIISIFTIAAFCYGALAIMKKKREKIEPLSDN